MICYYCGKYSNYYVGDKCKTIEFNDKEYIICLNCSNELIFKKDMEKYYCVKIDLRKKNMLRERPDLLENFLNKTIYVNYNENEYVSKSEAKRYCSLEEAQNAITEDFEIVSKL